MTLAETIWRIFLILFGIGSVGLVIAVFAFRKFDRQLRNEREAMEKESDEFEADFNAARERIRRARNGIRRDRRINKSDRY